MEATVRHIFPQDKKPKKTWMIAVVLVLLLIGNAKCNNGGKGFKPSPSDTIKTVCLYVEPLKGNLALDYVIRITKDSVGLKDGKVIKFRDSLYFTPFITELKKDGKPVLDSLGKPKVELAWQPHPKNLIIQDFKSNFPLNLNR